MEPLCELGHPAIELRGAGAVEALDGVDPDAGAPQAVALSPPVKVLVAVEEKK